MLSMKTTQVPQNLPLHLLIEKHAQDLKYGSVTYVFTVRNGVVDMSTINSTKAKRRRYKPEVAKR